MFSDDAFNLDKPKILSLHEKFKEKFNIHQHPVSLSRKRIVINSKTENLIGSNTSSMPIFLSSFRILKKTKGSFVPRNNISYIPNMGTILSIFVPRNNI